MTKIKICGLRSTKDIQMANQVMPDYIGFVFAGTKRKISDEQALKLKSILDPRILTVGVFVNDSIEHIASLCDQGAIDLVQLHGEESESYILKLRMKIGNPIIKAIRLQNRQDAKKIIDSTAEYILYDSFVESTIYGGSGRKLDLSLLPALTRPTFLAGGMSEENIKDVINGFNPYCIDVSSSVETDGGKDLLKMKRVISIVREYGGSRNE